MHSGHQTGMTSPHNDGTMTNGYMMETPAPATKPGVPMITPGEDGVGLQDQEMTIQQGDEAPSSPNNSPSKRDRPAEGTPNSRQKMQCVNDMDTSLEDEESGASEEDAATEGHTNEEDSYEENVRISDTFLQDPPPITSILPNNGSNEVTQLQTECPAR
jgi:hypothetical protein